MNWDEYEKPLNELRKCKKMNQTRAYTNEDNNGVKERERTKIKIVLIDRARIEDVPIKRYNKHEREKKLHSLENRMQ